MADQIQHISLNINPELVRKWREKHESTSLTISQIIRYLIAVDCGYTHEQSMLIAMSKQGTSITKLLNNMEYGLVSNATANA